jgi:hypothetical protein
VSWFASCVLFASPECYTSLHKTEFLDAAYDEVMQQLGMREKQGQRTWAWDRHRSQWVQGSLADALLLVHNKKFWCNLVRVRC